MHEGSADTLILERVLALDVGIEQFIPSLVEADKDCPGFRASQGGYTFRIIQAFPVLHGNWIHHVKLARDQGGNPGRGFLDRGEFNFSDVPLNVFPVVLVLLEDGFYVRLMAFNHERAGTIGIKVGVVAGIIPGGTGRICRAVLFRPTLVHDQQIRQVLNENGVRGRCFNDDGIVIDLGDILDLAAADLLV